MGWKDDAYNFGRGVAYREGKGVGKFFDWVYKNRNNKYMRAVADAFSPGVGIYHMSQSRKRRAAEPVLPPMGPGPVIQRPVGRAPMGFARGKSNRYGKHRNVRAKRYRGIDRGITRKLAALTPQPHYYRDCKLETEQFENSINRCNHQVIYNGTKADYDDLYVKPQIPVYYDPAGGTNFGWHGINPGLTDFADKGRWKCFLKQTLYATLQNNYNAPIRLVLFYGRYITDSDDNPIQLYTTDMTDLGHDNSNPTVQQDPRYKFQVGKVGRKFIRVRRVKHLMLQPGESTAIKLVNMKQYDPSLATATFLKGTQFVVVRMMGQVAHDTTDVSLIGTSESKVDITLKTYRVACLRQNYQLKTIGHDIGSYDNVQDAEIIDQDHPDPIDVTTTT